MLLSEHLTAAAVPALQVGAGVDGLERWLALLTSIATIVIALALIAIFLAVIPLALSARKIHRRVTRLVDRLQEQSEPILVHVRSVADNADFVSTAVRTDVEQLKRTIDAAQSRLGTAARGTEQRIRRFNNLLDLVQREAEDLFVGTASTFRGLRAGARALEDPAEPSPDLAWDEYDGYDPPAKRPARARRPL